MTDQDQLTRLRNSPLVHVIAQVVFSPVLDIGDRVKAVQAGLRKHGFIKLQVGQNQQLQIQDGGVAKIESKSRWEFVNRDDTLSFVLAEDFAVLQTSKYLHFPWFSQSLGQILELLSETTNISWVQRVGLRYINLFCPQDTEDYGSYLRPELLGFPFSEIAESVPQSVRFATQALADTGVGTIAVRAYLLPPNLSVPADLLPNGLKYPNRNKVELWSGVLDIDHFAMADFEFAGNAVMEVLSDLHRLTKVAFTKSVTDHALNRWGPEEVIDLAAGY